MSLKLVTLGRFAAYWDGEELADLSGQPLRCALLIFLALEGEPSRDTAMTLLWPARETARARHAMNQTVYELRRMLGDQWLRTKGEFLQVAPEVEVDATLFEAAVEDHEYDEALALFGGPFLGDLFLAPTPAFEAWASGRRSRLGGLHRRARSEVVRHLREAGEGDRALDVARAWLEFDPLEDEAHHEVVSILAELGRRAEALDHYERYETLVRNELGIEPLDQTKAVVDGLRTTSAERRSRGLDRRQAIGSAAPEVVRRHSGPPPDNSVAVLPFIEEAGEGLEHLAAGMGVALAEGLGEQGELRLPPSTSIRALEGQNLDATEIGRRLNVKWLVEGAVRPGAEGASISASLVKVEDGFSVWTKRFDDVDDLIDIRESLCRAVLGSIRGEGERRGTDRVVHLETADPKAYNLYILGQFSYEKRTPDGLHQAIINYEKALELDPYYARAYSGIADAYLALSQLQYARPSEVMDEAERAADRALALDPNLAEAHASRAHVLETYRWQWEEAETEYRRAIELNPFAWNARTWYADLLTALGRHSESRRQVLRAEEFEPYSVPIKFAKASQMYRSRRFGQAVGEFEQIIGLYDRYFAAWVFLALAQIAAGHPDLAVKSAQAGMERCGPFPIFQMALGCGYAAMGNEEGAREVLKVLETGRPVSYVPPLYRALVLGALGELDASLDALEESLEERHGQMIYLRVDPAFDPMREHPRFGSLLRTMGLE